MLVNRYFQSIKQTMLCVLQSIIDFHKLFDFVIDPFEYAFLKYWSTRFDENWFSSNKSCEVYLVH